MSTIKMYKRTGEAAGEISVPDSALVLKGGEQAVHDVVASGMAGARAGTASTLSKGEVAGSNKKPWKQKGTGRARAGLRQSPVWRGGGIAFGPKPRDYSTKVNKKVALLAFRRALSDRVASGAVKVVEDLSMKEPRTKLVAGMLKALEVKGACLIVTPAADESVSRAARNIPGVAVMPASEVGVYHIVRYPVIVASRAGWDKLQARLEGKAGKKDA